MKDLYAGGFYYAGEGDCRAHSMFAETKERIEKQFWRANSKRYYCDVFFKVDVPVCEDPAEELPAFESQGMGSADYDDGDDDLLSLSSSTSKADSYSTGSIIAYSLITIGGLLALKKLIKK